MSALLDVQLDLRERPFTDRGSRLLVMRGEADSARPGLRVIRVEYEVPLRDCVLLDELGFTADGTPLPDQVVSARPDRLRLADGSVQLVFADADTLVMVAPAGTRAHWRTKNGARHEQAVDPDGCLVLTGRRLPSTTGEALLAAARRRWQDWFDRMPSVPAEAKHLHPMAALAWWTLAVNQVPLAGAGGRTGLVPSKFGYLGAWNWDTCFHAVGLRHGAPELARAQLRLLLDHQLPDGQLPDVIHDGGVLADTTDLPRADLTRLAQHVGQALDAEAAASPTPTPTPARVPVTKPPLAAWAVWKVHEADPDPAFLAEVYRPLVRAHEWWFTHSDPDGDGLPEYLHPYSSGLDDSPIWDHGPRAEPPDLNSYLIHEADVLARIADCLDQPAEATEWRARAAAHTELFLARRWTGTRFCTLSAGREITVRTPLDLMPLFTGRLPQPVADRLVADLASPSFTGPYALPSVAFDDPEFDPESMWRGPAWLNVSHLVIDGLNRSGHPEAARALAHRALEMVAAGGGMFEYWNPLTARRAGRATTGFGWSSALFLDLAVTQGADAPSFTPRQAPVPPLPPPAPLLRPAAAPTPPSTPAVRPATSAASPPAPDAPSAPGSSRSRPPT
jgi:hypothetical protein